MSAVPQRKVGGAAMLNLIAHMSINGVRVVQIFSTWLGKLSGPEHFFKGTRFSTFASTFASTLAKLGSFKKLAQPFVANTITVTSCLATDIAFFCSH